jgi:hypothetical protein
VSSESSFCLMYQLVNVLKFLELLTKIKHDNNIVNQMKLNKQDITDSIFPCDVTKVIKIF